MESKVNNSFKKHLNPTITTERHLFGAGLEKKINIIISAISLK